MLLGCNLKDGAVHHPNVSNLLVFLNLLFPHQQDGIALAVRLVEGEQADVLSGAEDIPPADCAIRIAKGP